MPCRSAQPIDARCAGGERLGHQRVVVDRHRSSAAAGAAAAGRRWWPARRRRGLHAARPWCVRRPRTRPARSADHGRVLVDPHAGPDAGAAQPPGQPGRVEHRDVRVVHPAEVGRRVDLGAHLVRGRAGRASCPCARASSYSSRSRLQLVRLDGHRELAGALEVAVDAVLVHRGADRVQVLPAQSLSSSAISSGQRADPVAEARGSARPRRSRRCARTPPSRRCRPPPAARPARDRAPWRAAPSTARSSRRRRPAGRRCRPRQVAGAGSGSGRSGPSSQYGVGAGPGAATATTSQADRRRPPPPVVLGAQHQQQRDHEHRRADDVDLRRDAALGGAPDVHREGDRVAGLKFVMMKSSNDSEKPSSAAATMPGNTSGKRDPPERLPLAGVEVHRRLLQRRSSPASRALTVTTTNDTQNITCAITIVQKPSCRRSPGRRTAPAATSPSPSRAWPSAGRSAGWSPTRPRNRCRTSANAISVPSTVATTVARKPICRL